MRDKIKFRLSNSKPLIILVVVSLVILPFATTLRANAAALTQVEVRFDRMKASEPTTGTVCAKPTTVGTEASVMVSFPTGYTLGAAGTFTVNTSNLAWPTGGTAWLGINTATNVTGQDVTFPSTDLVVGTLYCFNWVNSAAVAVKAGATSSNVGAVTTQATGPATIDSSSYTTASITDDQIVVTATVPSAFAFALSGNTDALGVLTTGAVATSPTPRTVTVNTNAKNGWSVWAKDINTGLASASAAATIPSLTYNAGAPTTVVAGTAGYNTGVTSTQVGGTGVVSVDAGFNGTTLNQGGGLSTTLRALATSTGPADTAVLTIKNNIAINATTPAASDYTDTITVIGAGLF